MAYVRGVPADWSGGRNIVHYTSRNLVDWTHAGIVPLSSDRVIDAFVYAKREGGWRMWYNGRGCGGTCCSDLRPVQGNQVPDHEVQGAAS